MSIAIDNNPPFPSHDGSGDYVFISYSHRDSEDVYQQLVQLNDDGIAVWYDEGIHAGEHWNEELARAIRRCRVFLFFVSPRSVVSNHCLRELNFAMSTDRPVLAVHLEHTELPDGVQFAIGDRQAIVRSRYSRERYQIKLLETLKGLLSGERSSSVTVQAQAPGNNLPSQPERLFGRSGDIEKTTALIQSHRVVTLVGTGGAGKTTLAEACAAELLDDISDGVWLVRLAALGSGGLIAQQIAQTLGVTEIAGTSIDHTLIDFLRPRGILLVIDNCEHVVSEVAALTATLIAQCPRLRILATSREPLHVSGESVYQVAPLLIRETEDSDEPPAAMQLFAERAAAVQSGFTINADNREAVYQICQRVGGIPLAIELAAARCKVMSVSDIAERLSASFKALGRGRRDTVAHHQTLAATLEWSYQLLDDDERAVLRRLSVFHGRFDLEAAETICADDIVDQFDVVDQIDRLVDKSLIEADTDGSSASLSLLATIREFAGDKLEEEGQRDAVAERHRDYYLDFAENSSKAIQIDPARSVARLDALQDNLRAALRWSLDQQHGAEALRMVGALSYYWVLSGSAAEKRTWYEQALRYVDQVPLEVRAPALLGAGMAAGLDADYANSKQWLGAAEQAFSELGMDAGVAWARFWQGRNATARVWSGIEPPAHLQEAETHYQAALGWFLPNKDGFGIILSLSFSAWAAQLGQRDDAIERIEQAIGAARQAGIERGELVSRAHMANLRAGLGEHAIAINELDRCIEGLIRLGDQLNARICVSLAGLIGLATGNREYALARARDAVSPDSKLRTREWEPPRLGLAALVLADRGEYTAAYPLLVVLDQMLPSWHQCLAACGLRDAEQRANDCIREIDASERERIAENAKQMTIGDAISHAYRALRIAAAKT